MTRLRSTLLALVFALNFGSASADPVLVSDGRYVMGTILEITLVTPDEAGGWRLLDELFSEAKRHEALFSTYYESSEISQLNRSAGGAANAVSPEVSDLLRQSKLLAHKSQSSFDVTVGPLIELWTRAGRLGRLPTSAELESARSRVGSKRIRITSDDRVALAPGMQLNLGAIAKGWSLDRIADRLQRSGVRNALLNFGQSSIRALGSPPDAESWHMAIRTLDSDATQVVRLRDQALSVSASFGQWTEIEGRRFGHVIDPRSGSPLIRKRQVSVVSDSATVADAMSTALLILDREVGIQLLDADATSEGRIVEPGYETATSAGWRRAVVRLDSQAATQP